MFKVFITLIVLLNINSVIVFSLESPIEKSLPCINNVLDASVIQMKLKNGMEVWLKPTVFEKEEINIKLAAKGGLSSLTVEDLPSGKMAAQIAFESGIGDYTAKQISELRYQYSLEFVVSLLPFSRVIDGSTGEYGLEVFLKGLNLVFTEQNFTEQGWQSAREIAQDTIKTKLANEDEQYETKFLALNTGGLKLLEPLSESDLDRVNFAKAKKFFKESFLNPAEFVCVIVGNFDLFETQRLVEHHLASIPASHFKQSTHPIYFDQFPKGITQENMYFPKRVDAMSRITFPLNIDKEEKTLLEMAFMCQLIGTRLRHVITEKTKLSYGVEVSYEFPRYPLLDHPWMSIHYRCEATMTHQLKEIVLAELDRLQKGGITERELSQAKLLEIGADEFWLTSNSYWVSMLTNYHYWKWNPNGICRGHQETNNFSIGIINNLLKKAFTKNNYSVLTALPSNEG